MLLRQSLNQLERYNITIQKGKKMNQNRITNDCPSMRSKVKVRKARKCDWSVIEQISYVQFLKSYKHLMSSTVSRKENKIFKQMSSFVKTRTTIQCKSHHQKMEARLKNIPAIIIHVSDIVQATLETDAIEKVQQYPILYLKNGGTQQAIENLDGDHKMRLQQNERLNLASYCSFFDEFSENYGQIEGGIILNESQLYF